MAINVFDLVFYPEQVHVIEPGVCGVYFLLDSGSQVVYVGRSSDLRQRLKQHFSGNSSVQGGIAEVTNFAIFPLKDKKMSIELERFLITHFRPPLNKAFNFDSDDYLPNEKEGMGI